jgi:hypothetical protein
MRRTSEEQLASLFGPVAEQLINNDHHILKTRVDKITGGGSKLRADRIQGKVPADVLGLVDDSQITTEPNDASGATNLEDMLQDIGYAIAGVKDAALGLPVGRVASTRILDIENHVGMGTLTGIAVTTNRLFFAPFFAPHDVNINAVLFEITAAVTGSVQCGIYSNNSTAFLPVSQLALGPKTSYSTTGVKTQAISRLRLAAGKWYWAAMCSVTSHSIRGTQVAGVIPSLRGGGANSFTNKYIMCFQDLTAGWTNIPATASPSSGPADTWLKIAAQQGT